MSFKSYRGGLYVGAGLKPDGDGVFPLMESCDIQVSEDGKRLDAALSEINTALVGGELDEELTEQENLILQIVAALQGKTSAKGNAIGISSIEKTYTNGLVDTYTMTFTDESTFIFTITNGKDGHSPVITIQGGYWYIDGKSTGVKAEGKDGNNAEAPVQSVNGQTGAVKLDAADVGARPSTWTPTYSEVGADKSGTASTAVSTHNTNNTAHNDIRLELKALSDRINAALDSDDTTLDELSEIVAYIKSNKALIDAITTSKVNVSDIINDLVSNVTNKPLSAAQGVALKALIDALDTDKLDTSALTGAINTALAQAKANGEFDGTDGKSAYEYAKDGGYTGSESEFAEKLAAEWQLKTDETLKTTDKTVVGAINELSNKTVNNILSINTPTLDSVSYNESNGVWWGGYGEIYYSKISAVLAYMGYNAPIVAGENVTFETDEDNKVVKINASSGVNKIAELDTWAGETNGIDTTGGISWEDTYCMYDEEGKTVSQGAVYHKIPLVAGENVTFSNEGEVVKINASGGSTDLSKFYPMFCQALAIPYGIQEVNESFYSIDAYDANGNTVLFGEDFTFDDLVEQSIYGTSQECELEFINLTDFCVKVCVKVTWEETLEELTPREKIVTQWIYPQQAQYIYVQPIQQGSADERSWGFEILGARFTLNDYE